MAAVTAFRVWITPEGTRVALVTDGDVPADSVTATVHVDLTDAQREALVVALGGRLSCSWCEEADPGWAGDGHDDECPLAPTDDGDEIADSAEVRATMAEPSEIGRPYSPPDLASPFVALLGFEVDYDDPLTGQRGCATLSSVTEDGMATVAADGFVVAVVPVECLIPPA